MTKVKVLSKESGIPYGTIIDIVDETEDDYIGEWWVTRHTFLEVEVPKRICSEVNI